MPIAFWRLPAAQLLLHAALGEHLDPPLGEPDRGGDGVAEQGQSPSRKTASAASSAIRSTYLGGDITKRNDARLGAERAHGDYIRKAPGMAL